MIPVLGIDLGSSRSRALLLGEGDEVLLVTEGGPGNLTVAGEAVVAGSLEQLLAGIRGRPGPGPAACCCGAAGVDDEATRRRLSRLLARLLPAARVEVVPDPLLVLAAAGLDEGVALISGTGSIAYGVAQGRVARAGGWGPRLGDEGSGYWAASDAVRAVLRAHDEGRPLDSHQRALLAAVGVRDPLRLAHLFHREPDPWWWARLAPVALRDADRLERAAQGLAELARTVRARLDAELPVVLAGRVLLNTPGLEARVRRRLPGDRTLRLTADPVMGAALRARRLLPS